ncbi:MAG TPA: glycosyltransferase family 4 protein [Candidatus Paceibacterota bacterium]
MRIHFITSKLKSPDKAGGSVIEIDFMMREMIRLGHEVTAVTLFSGNNDKNLIAPYKIIEENIKSPRWYSIQRATLDTLRKYEERADVFVLDGQFIHGAGFYKFRGGRTPVAVYMIRPPLVKENYVSDLFVNPIERFYPGNLFRKLKYILRYLVERYVLSIVASHVNLVLCTNPMLLNEHLKFGLVPAKRGLVIGEPYPIEKTMKEAGIDENYYSSKTGQDKEVIVYCTGRMVPGKGYDLLLTAFVKLRNKNYKLILGGSGPEEPLIRDMVKKLKLEDKVEFSGWVTREKLREYLKRVDIYVLAKWGSPNLSVISLIEVLSYGVPPIVPSGTALSWQMGKAALTFTPDDPDSLAETIEKLGADVELRRTQSRAGYDQLRNSSIDPRQTMLAMEIALKKLIQA